MHIRVSWALFFKPLGFYPVQDIIRNLFEQPHAKCHSNLTWYTLLRFQPSLSKHSRVLGIQSGKAGHAMRAYEKRQPASQTETTERNINCERDGKEKKQRIVTT